ncbi:hypothetical protein [Roseivirga thermotolerans]|uniref:hypothetical protein n=1 Tax=Roseivirga thermotolerans TaxID=1758176 RepID=UPI00273E3DA7|nr:hypothetical protein [Roseivirga thermotolerans]
MKSTLKTLLISLSIVAFSCSRSPENTDTEEPIVVKETLASEQFLEEELGLAPYIVGPYLLVKQDQKRADKVVFTVYNASDLEFLGVLGERGREGPNTFYGVSYWGQFVERNGDYLIWINDPPRYRMSLINITESLERGETVIERHLNHDPENDFMNALYVLDSLDLVAHQPGYHPNTNQAPLVMFKNGVIETYGEYPEVKNILDEQRWGNGATFNRVALAMKPDQSRFAVAMDYYDRLDIFDRDGQFIMSYRDPEKYALYNYSDIITPSKSVPRQYRDYYYGTAATKDFLFTLYYDVSVEKWAEFHPTTIRIFDWEGNLKAQLACPDKLWNLSVDEENGYLYGGSYQQETLFRYNIESVLKALKANP